MRFDFIRRLQQFAINILASALLVLAPIIAIANQAPPILLANVLGQHIDPAAYLVSEKYDGVRAIWDGKFLRFRSGRTVNAPDWFLARLPAEKLDGELWLARDAFERLSGYVRKTSPLDEDWRQIKYMVFELPDGAGTFADRSKRIQTIVGDAKWPQLVAVEQFKVADRATLKRRLDEVIKDGGEGLMLHLADATYVTGRSDVLLKLKPAHDTEAIVVEHIPGKGKYTGQMGALRVQMPDGKRMKSLAASREVSTPSSNPQICNLLCAASGGELDPEGFNIGTGFSDAIRKNPPPVGTNVTYTYRGVTNKGTPRFASFLRIRQEF